MLPGNKAWGPEEPTGTTVPRRMPCYQVQVSHAVRKQAQLDSRCERGGDPNAVLSRSASDRTRSREFQMITKDLHAAFKLVKTLHRNCVGSRLKSLMVGKPLTSKRSPRGLF